MYPLDLSVAAGARRAQFLSWAFPTGTKIQKPPAYDGPSVLTDGPSYAGGFWILVPVRIAELKNCDSLNRL